LCLAAPDGRLVRVCADGRTVDARGSPGDAGTALFLQPAGEGRVFIATCASPGGGCAYVAVGAPPGLRVEAVPDAACATAVRLAPARAHAPAAAWPPAPALTPEQLGAFMRDGYLIVKGAAGPLAVEAALRHFNSVIGALAGSAGGGAEEARDALLNSDHPAALSLLLRTRVGGVAARLCSKLTLPKRAQLAPRYPQPLPPACAERAFAEEGAPLPAADGDPLGGLGEKRTQGPRSRWHVDGVDAAKRGGEARLAPFSLLVAVALSDTPHEGAGQFTVFPGSHLELCALVAAQGEGALLAGARPPLAAQPAELRLAAGDAVFAHPLLAHRIGVNFSSKIRAAVFFRLHHKEHTQLRAALLGGKPWAELDAVVAGGHGA
jgi:hypothetical protein